MSRFSVMIVDDDREMRESLTVLLDIGGFEARAFEDGAEALETLAERSIDVVLCDMRMLRMDGLEFQRRMKGRHRMPLVLMSAHGDIPTAVNAVQEGAFTFLEKPFDPRRLLEILKQAAEKHRATLGSERQRHTLAETARLDRVLLGNAPQIVELREEIADLAKTDVNIVLVGETGTGKELVARALHDLGTYASGPFVPVRCPSLPAGSGDDMLFGGPNSVGLCERAANGTLFLDEFSWLPFDLQVRFLRVFEAREAEGGREEVSPSNGFRIVSAISEEPRQAVSSGRLRQDLLFRLGTVVLQLPPLRERGDDVAHLYASFLGQFAGRYAIEAPVPTNDDLGSLLAHDWPGNVRELRSVAERHVLAARRGRGSVRAALRADDRAGGMPTALRSAVASFERQIISRALKTHKGRMDDIASSLGIGRRTLNEKIVKLGLDKGGIIGAEAGSEQGRNKRHDI